MKIDTYNQDGKKIAQTLLPKEIFDIEINPDLIHQVVISQMANKRKVLAHVKTRAEVSGGGRKPWRQKGTGRARHGSIRSPIWRGGGVVFGPRKNRVFKKIIPKKMKKKALFMTLTGKAKNNLLILIDKLEIEKPKTKLVQDIVEKLPCKKKKVLIVLPKLDRNTLLAARNLSSVQVIEARTLNALDVFSFKYLILLKDSIKKIKETFLKK